MRVKVRDINTLCPLKAVRGVGACLNYLIYQTFSGFFEAKTLAPITQISNMQNLLPNAQPDSVKRALYAVPEGLK
jgi:hypothetical protein